MQERVYMTLGRDSLIRDTAAGSHVSTALWAFPSAGRLGASPPQFRSYCAVG